MMGDVFNGARLETAVWAGKLLVLCVGLVTTTVFFKAAIIPYLLNLTLSTLPQLWTSFRSYCLSPLYIYIILNFIIIIIACTSTFQNQKQKHPSSSSSATSSLPSSYYSSTDDNMNSSKTSDHEKDTSNTAGEYKIETSRSETGTVSPLSSLLAHQFSNEMIGWHDIHIIQLASTAADEEIEEESVRTMSSTNDPSPEEHGSSEDTDRLKFFGEWPHSEEAEDNTLDTTWNAIMERQGKLICKQLKKSETWDTPPRTTHLVRSTIIQASREDLEDQLHDLHNNNNKSNDSDDINSVVDDRVAWARKELKKSDTFSDRVTMTREKSMTQEELKQRAEAFINKINNQMRLQRLESDQRFREMVNSGGL